MNTVLALAPDEQLLQWLLTVARRADELARETAGFRDTDRRLWLRAEFEIFERAERAAPHGLLEATFFEAAGAEPVESLQGALG